MNDNSVITSYLTYFFRIICKYVHWNIHFWKQSLTFSFLCLIYVNNTGTIIQENYLCSFSKFYLVLSVLSECVFTVLSILKLNNIIMLYLMCLGLVLFIRLVVFNSHARKKAAYDIVHRLLLILQSCGNTLSYFF